MGRLKLTNAKVIGKCRQCRVLLKNGRVDGSTDVVSPSDHISSYLEHNINVERFVKQGALTLFYVCFNYVRKILTEQTEQTHKTDTSAKKYVHNDVFRAQ